MTSSRTRFYRDKQHSKFMGVCSGIADYTGINSIWIRLGFIFSLFVTGGSTFLAYLIVGLLADRKPAHLYVDQREQKFWQGVRQSPTRTAAQVKSRFREIDRRLADVESYYTSNNARLSNEIESLR